MVDCPEVCNSDLSSDLMSSFTNLDLTNVIDRVCGGAMLLTDDAGLNVVDDALSGEWLSTDSPRTRIVTSLPEVSKHYPVSSETYKAAKTFFSNPDRGIANYMFISLWDIEGGESPVTALDLVNTCQPCWLNFAVVHYDKNGIQLMDDVRMIQIAEWAQINEKIAYLLSIDPDLKDPSNTSNIKAQLFNLGINETYVHYTEGYCEIATDPMTGQALTYPAGAPVFDALGQPVTDPVTGDPVLSDGTEQVIQQVYPYIELLAAGYVSKVDLSQSESRYTLAYKPRGGEGFVGLKVDTFDRGTVDTITGVFSDGQINPYNNGHANVYVRTAGYNVIFNGMTVGGNYVDQVHLKFYLRRRIQDSIAQLMVNNRSVPFDDARGQKMIAEAVGSVMRTAQNNGHFTKDPQNWEQTGNYIQAGVGWVIRQDSFSEQTAARKRARLAPQMRVCYIPAGSTHHVPVTLCTLAVPTAV